MSQTLLKLPFWTTRLVFFLDYPFVKKSDLNREYSLFRTHLNANYHELGISLPLSVKYCRAEFIFLHPGVHNWTDKIQERDLIIVKRDPLEALVSRSEWCSVATTRGASIWVEEEGLFMGYDSNIFNAITKGTPIRLSPTKPSHPFELINIKTGKVRLRTTKASLGRDGIYQIIKWYNQGLRLTKIAHLTNTTPQHVYYYVKNFRIIEEPGPIKKNKAKA